MIVKFDFTTFGVVDEHKQNKADLISMRELLKGIHNPFCLVGVNNRERMLEFRKAEGFQIHHKS